MNSPAPPAQGELDPAFADAQDHCRTIRDVLRFAVTQFGHAELYFGHGYPGPTEEAAYLIEHTLCLPHDRRDWWLDARLAPAERARVLAVLRRRIRERIPAAYITREAWLGECRFYVDERVIVPRSFIADILALGLEPWLDVGTVTHAADICTGGGSLAILLALAAPTAQVDAVDISPEALAVARRNVDDYGLAARVRLVEGNLYSGLGAQRYELIVSNPPYVDQPAMDSLPREYRWEPRLALESGRDGLDHIRRLLADAPEHLTPQGVLVVEAGHQRHVVDAAFPELPLTWLDSPDGETYVFLLRREDLD